MTGSTTDDVKQALERKAASPAEQTALDLIARQRPAIEQVLPPGVSLDRFERIVRTELRRTPLLGECEPVSFLNCVMFAAQLGLEPGPLGLVYLVPYKREATFVLGYLGMIELARRSGQLKDVATVLVHEGDTFEYEEGLRPKFRYVDAPPAERGELVCAAGLARFTNGGSYLRRLWPDEIEARRKRSPLGRENKGPWAADTAAMQRKTVIRAMRPGLPLTALAATALEVDEGAITELPLDGAVSPAEATDADIEP